MAMRTWYVMLSTALALGLAWAIRGHFGHEWGAAWAGGCGGLALLVGMRDPRWMRRAPALAALCAIGWGAGGIMSYGIVIGYCRGTEFIDVVYGFSMLAVIGGLYGFLGGGLFGLGLESADDPKPQWAGLLAEMVAGAWLAWGLLIYQLEWLMTPPRSELWAACLGASLALAWYLYREGYVRALRVAAYSALGAGLGFALGNFFQVLGSSFEIRYNWWNVMEFTLGFCGGLGMAYAVATQVWPAPAAPSRLANRLALLFLLVAVPFVNHVKAVRSDPLTRLAESLGMADSSQFATQQQAWAWALAALLAVGGLILWRRYEARESTLTAAVIPGLFFAYLALYLLFSYITAGLFYKPIDFTVSHTAYVPLLLLLAVLWAIWGRRESHEIAVGRPESALRWLCIAACAGLFLVIIAQISIHVHDEPLGGAHQRFSTGTTARD